MILDLLKQYCDAKQIRFEFQRCIAGYCFDAVIAGRIAIEFDEPHHQEAGRTAAGQCQERHVQTPGHYDVEIHTGR